MSVAIRVPGSLPLSAVREQAVRLMSVRQVVAVEIRVRGELVLAYRRDVAASDELAARVIEKLERES